MSNERKQTIRQEIISHLKSGPMTARDISQSVSIMEKDVYHHLAFIEKTVRRQKKKNSTAICYIIKKSKLVLQVFL